MNFKLIPAAVALFACTGALAAPEDDSLPWVMGTGAVSCGKLLAAVRTNNEGSVLNYVTWAQGYMSGVNSMKDKRAKNLKVDHEAIRAYLTKHCRDKPLDDVVDAVTALMIELYQKP